MRTLKHLLIATLTVLGVVASAMPLQAALFGTFNFSGTSNGGVGSATMTVDVTGTVLTLTIDNTSPTTYGDPAKPNIASITGFGINLDNSPAIASWSLSAFTNAGVADTIGSSSGSGDWTMNLVPTGSFAGVQMDYLPHVQGVDGALYNPDMAALLGANTGKNTNYYTTATLTIEFDAVPDVSDFVYGPINGQNSDPNPFVRFQQVGSGGSLKLGPTPENPTVPEPLTLVLWAGLGLCGLVRARLGSKQVE